MGLISYTTANGVSADSPGNSATLTDTWTHGGVSTPNGLAVVTLFMVTAGGASSSVTCTYGGQSMTLQGVRLSGSGDSNRLAMFTLLNPPTGSQTVTFNWTGLSFTLPGKPISGISTTYRNVQSVRGYTGANGYGTTASVSLTGVMGSEFTLFAHARQVATNFSTFSPTSRYTVAMSTNARTTVGDDTGNAGTVTSTATMSASDYWASSGLVVRRFAEGDFFG
jgi:hypothetical protein